MFFSVLRIVILSNAFRVINVVSQYFSSPNLYKRQQVPNGWWNRMIHRKPETRNLDVFFDLRLNKRLSKHSWDCWFETPLRSLWRHCNGREGYNHLPICPNCNGVLVTQPVKLRNGWVTTFHMKQLVFFFYLWLGLCWSLLVKRVQHFWMPQL